MPIFRKHDDAPRERTPEERERARAEREARRAARTGAPPPPDLLAEPPGAEAPPAERDDVVEEPHDFAAEPRDVAPEEPPPRRDFAAEPRDVAPEEPPDFARDPRDYGREPVDEPPPPTFGAGAPETAEPVEEGPLQPTAPFDPLGDEAQEVTVRVGEEVAARAAGPATEVAEPEREREPVVPPDGAEPEREPVVPPEVAEPEREREPIVPPEVAEPEREPIVPPAARRARSGRVVPRDDGERPVPPKPISAKVRRLPPTPPPPGTPAFSKRRRRRGRILATLALLLFALFLFGLNLLFEPFKGEGEGGETVTVRIPPNSTVADVGDVLADNEIVDNSLLFVIRARLAGADLKAGTYQLKKDSSYGDALDALSNDPAAPRTVKVVIPEGRSRSETAPLIKEAGLAGDYLAASDTSKGFRPRKYGAPRGTKTLEGFLFPATYELSPGVEASRLVTLQLDAFEQNIAKVDMKRAKRRNLTVYDVLTIASMVEREATLAKERPIIAAVIHNRLRQGMPLGIDATIRYAVRNWSRPLKESELNIDSPYNTRKRTGLPPTPIGSPGLDSIRAAANPAKVGYLFYVVKPGGNGAHNFSSTDEEFQKDVDAYNDARERLGGKSPAGSG